MNTSRANNVVLDSTNLAVGNCQVLAASRALLDILDKIGRYSLFATIVLLTGETGVGKEVLAKLLHDLSSRRRSPLVAVNCAAIPGEMMESELFGHERGAFTGAVRRHIGHFERADKGTLFLDEIGDLDLSLQAKTLRAIATNKIQRVGSEHEIHVDCRIVAATKYDLKKRVIDGLFRDDLYYRIAVGVIDIPPLRERPDDIIIFAEHFIKEISNNLGKVIRPLDPATMGMLATYPWPGNVRELRNEIERAIALTDTDQIDRILLENAGTGNSISNVNLKDLTITFQKSLITYSLQICKTQVKAAKKLGIPFRTLRDKMSRYGMCSDTA